MRIIHTEQIIDAPLGEVWAVLTDTAAFGDWNPFITAVSGELTPGARLSVSILPPGGKAMTFRPTVIAAEPGRLEWLGKLLVTGLFDGRHMFLAESTNDGRTTFIQREEFSGLLVPLMPGLLSSTEAGFRAMNAALAAEVEARRTAGAAK